MNDVARILSPRSVAPEALASLQAAHKQTLETMLKELQPQAPFCVVRGPEFGHIRENVYLELSLNTTLDGAAGLRSVIVSLLWLSTITSRILIRPVLGYLKLSRTKQDPKFDGIGYSTTIHLPGKNQPASGSEAVEFFFP